MRPSTRWLAALATVVTGVGVGAFGPAPAAQADTVTATFFYSGAEQTFAIPPSLTRVHVDVVGGHGGRSVNQGNTDTEPGGQGGEVSADIDVPLNTPTLYIEVGGNGQDADVFSPGVAAGGWNGGGAGQPFGGAGGGGASDVRTTPRNEAGSLESRLLVAAGGGGAALGAPGGASFSPGGAADPNCTDHGGPGGAGTSSGPGAGGSKSTTGYADGGAGNQDVGGDGGGNGAGNGGGGGGGGLFGGGGGGNGQYCGGGGGGGSSYFSGSFSSFISDFGNRTWITVSYVVPMKPLVTTTPASGIGQTSATLNGVVTPETVTPPDSGALCQFDIGTDTQYGLPPTALQPCGIGTDQVAYSDTATNLLPNTTYHYKLVASNRYGYNFNGNDMQFTTLSPPPPAPSAVTSPATNVGQHIATLHGVVNPEGYATTYYFRYGKTASYGRTTANRSAGSGSSDVNAQAALSGLLRHTTYHVRIVAVNANGTTLGADRTFRTG